MIKYFLRTRLAYLIKEKIINSKYAKIYKRENTLHKKLFLKNISSFKITPLNSRGENVLVQQLESYEFTIKIAIAIKAYSLNNSIKVYSYKPYFNKKLGWINYEEKHYFFFFKSFNKRLYRVLGYKFLFDLDEKYFDQIKVKNHFTEIYSKVITKEDVLNIKIENILVGDLIYDTYLRFYGNHTIENIQDENLKNVIYYTIDNYYMVKNHIKKKCITALFTSYTTYISHGLAVRICLDKNIPVYAFGSNSYFIQKLEKSYAYHVQKFWNFSNKVLNHDQNKEVEDELNYRFSGGIDKAISYMQTTSFAPKSTSQNYFSDRRKRNVVVYVHDIYDSPHGFKNFLYPDFYTFILDLSEQIKDDKSTKYYFKFHPNAVGDSNQKIADYLTNLKSEAISLLPLDVSNLDVIDFRPDLVVTVNGTIGLEMAYFQIPVVALVDNLYMNFSFVHSCHSISDYYKVILGNEKVNVRFEKSEIYSFYYQAYKKDLEGIDKSVLDILSIQHDTSSDIYLKKVNDNFDFSLFEKIIELLESKFN